MLATIANVVMACEINVWVDNGISRQVTIDPACGVTELVNEISELGVILTSRMGELFRLMREFIEPVIRVIEPVMASAGSMIGFVGLASAGVSCIASPLSNVSNK